MLIERIADLLANCESRGDCWVWKGSTNANGTPVFRDSSSGKTGSVTKRALAISGVEVPKRSRAESTCGYKWCCNPNHLRLVEYAPVEAASLDAVQGPPLPPVRDKETFLMRVEKTEGCWNWTAGTCRGYGALRFGGQVAKAHRVSYELFNGPPGGLDVLHRCDRPICVAPHHLFLGTQADNSLDMHAKGRAVFVRGEEAGGAVLSAVEVSDIRRIYATGRFTQAQIAEDFGIHQTTVSLIVRRKKWRHV